MRRKIYLMLLLLVGFVSLQAQNNYGIGEGFDPANPGNPDAPATTYTLRAEASPRNGGSLSISSDEVESGATVWLYAYNNRNYRFEKWVENGETVSTASSFEYTMPARDVTLTAVFVFDPENPANPDTLAIKHNVTVVAEPQSGGSFNFSNSEFTQGQEVSLYAYPSTNYEFNGWQVDGKTVSMSQPYTFIPTGNVRVTGLFTFNPSNPSNPGRNSFNQETGELILDDFEPGYIMNAVDEAIGGSGNRGRVTMVTVSGRMESYDFGIANYLSACTYFDFSRTFGYTEVPSYAFDGTGVTSVILPSCVENIGYGAFMDCQMLTELSLYSVTPPSLQNSVFSGVPDGLVVRVLSNAIPLYSENESWSGYTLLPLTAEVRTLEVSLPAEAADGRYKDMSLELVNSASGQAQKYVVSDRISYTFYGLIKNSEFNVYLKNSVGSVLGTIEGVKVVDEDVKTAFETILTPKDVTLAVVTADGTDVTAQTKIEWTRADGTYLAQGNAVSGLTDGTELAYRVTLDRTLGMQCVEPGKHDFTVGEENAITLTLQPIKQVALGGVVKDEDGQPMSGVTVAVTQQLNGKYSKAFSVSTGSDGAFNLQVYGEPSSISASYTDYITQTLSTDTLTSDTNVGTITMREITGARISTNLTFTPSVAEGETAETQSWYDDYANIEYSVYNKTAGKAVSQFSVQYPTIALIDETSPGDVLEITARSKTGAFMPVTVEATPIDEQNNAEATIAIVELGGISASFSSTDNSAVVGLLYDANGRLVKKYSYSTASLTISGLQDGDYTLVTMANSNLFSGLSMLSQYETAGLVAGTDYVSNSVTVTSGRLATVANGVVPTLDESKLYYTGEKTMASVNKTSIVAGNYLTLRGVVDFKQEFAGSVSDAKLVMDLPDNTTFVENSVMVGSNIAGYSLDGDHLVIPLNGSTEQVRFCVIPELGGTYSPSLFAEFTVNGQTMTQPIGSVNYEVKDVSINVPSNTSSKQIFVSGTSIAKSEVAVYENGVLVGNTTALGNGNWQVTCELNAPYPNSFHNVYATIKTPNGLDLQTETRTISFDSSYVDVESVRMLCSGYDFTFDFKNPRNNFSYSWPGCGEDFTFLIGFTENDTTKVSNVKLNILGMDNHIRVEPAEFNKEQNCWVVMAHYDGSSSLPVNVSVDFTLLTGAFDDTARDDAQYANMSEAFDDVWKYIEDYAEFELLTDEDEKVSYIVSTPNTTSKYEVGLSIIDASALDLSDFTLLKDDTTELYIREVYADNVYAATVVDKVDDISYEISIKNYSSSARSVYGRSTTVLSPKNMGRIFDLGLNIWSLVPFVEYTAGVFDYRYWQERIPRDLENLDSENGKTVQLLLAKCPDGTYKVDRDKMLEFEDRLNGLRYGTSVLSQSAYSMLELWNSRLRNAFVFETATACVGTVAKGLVHGAAIFRNTKFARYFRNFKVKGKNNRKRLERSIDVAMNSAGELMDNLHFLDFVDHESISEDLSQWFPNTCSKYHALYYLLQREIMTYSKKCEDPELEPEPDPRPDFPLPEIEPIIDPSGYVYEAVSSNRLEGVTATCYYKETVEDMYGDLHENVVLWDAAEYAQENPLFTDENGMYRWDVPQGLWQVKFEKEGYQTTYSEWLPVPPPQLEVNIAMTQDRQPEVKAAVAYEDGLEVEFDKYMQPETMTTENIFATKDGVTVEGSIVMKNEEQAYGDGSESYVSRVRFVPTTPFITGDKVTLTVSRRVKSYAGIQMETDYSQQFDIVKEVKEIASDSLLRVPYTGERELRVSVLPFDAAVGRTLRAKSSSEMIAVVTPEAVLDENGQATLRVSGELPGSAVITFTVDGVDATATTTVKVAADYYDVVTPAPTASRISGTEVYKGTEITLTCEDTDAVIYYTTDGSCPCDEQNRKEYTEPIVVDADMTLKAVAISDGKEESDVAEFTYKLKRTATAMKLKKGWNWLSHNLDEPVTPETLAGGATEAFVGSGGNVSGETLAAQSYKAKVAEDRSFTIEGVQVNPGNVAINLRSGWNWIGFPVGQAMSVTEAMTDATPDNYDCIVGQEGFAQYAGDAWQGTLDVMRPGQGYMYLSGSDKSFTYFTDIVSKANSLYQTGKGGDAVWTADAYAYPDVMCFVTQLYDGDVEAEEGKYVVGAFSGDECRGVGSFADGRLCISVAGEDGDAIRFIAFDVDSERSYNVDETFSFSQSVQGNFDLPQALHIGDVPTGINSVTARDDFGATITGGKLRITLDGPIDGVALISADGMCVLKSGWDTGAVYKDVSMVPDGVYILLVESEGKMYHKKIVKKP